MRADLVRVLVILARDGDVEVREAAEGQIAALPADEMSGLLSDPTVDEDVLDYFARAATSAVALRDAVIANPATPADALRTIAGTMSEAQIDLMLLNLNRLIRTPDLIDHLAQSPSLTPLQQNRLEEIRRHFLETPGPEPTPAPLPQTPSAEDTQPIAAAGDAEAEAAPRTEEAREEGESGHATETAVEPPDGALIENANQKIMRLNTSEKIQLALKGTR